MNTDKINELREEIKVLEARDAAYNAQTPEQMLAEEMHELQCHWNHTDGCSWFYETQGGVNDWNASSHSGWLLKARKIGSFCRTNNMESETALKLMRFLKAI